MFDAAGFERVLVTEGHSGGLPRLLVRLDLRPDARLRPRKRVSSRTAAPSGS
jgi:hypothetical protein